MLETLWRIIRPSPGGKSVPSASHRGELSRTKRTWLDEMYVRQNKKKLDWTELELNSTKQNFVCSRWPDPTRPCPIHSVSWRCWTVATPTLSSLTTGPAGSTAPRSAFADSWRSTSLCKRSTHVSHVTLIFSLLSLVEGWGGGKRFFNKLTVCLRSGPRCPIGVFDPGRWSQRDCHSSGEFERRPPCPCCRLWRQRPSIRHHFLRSQILRGGRVRMPWTPLNQSGFKSLYTQVVD